MRRSRDEGSGSPGNQETEKLVWRVVYLGVEGTLGTRRDEV